MIFLVPLFTPIGRVGCGACCPAGTNLFLSISSRTIFYSQIGLDKDIITNMTNTTTNTTIHLDYGLPQKGISRSVEFEIFFDSFMFPGLTFEYFKLDKKSDVTFRMELNISSNNVAIRGLRVWGENNTISFIVHYLGDMPQVEKTMGPSNATITDNGDGRFSMTAPWNLEGSGHIFESKLCWDGSCPWWLPDKNHCPP